MRLVRARAHASLANLGHGFDVFGLCVDAGFDEVELSRAGRGVTLTVEGDGAHRLPTSLARNTAGLAARLATHTVTPRIRLTPKAFSL